MEHFAVAGIGVIIMLVGAIYHDTVRRIGKLEGSIERVGEDVQYIKAHCEHCRKRL